MPALLARNSDGSRRRRLAVPRPAPLARPPAPPWRSPTPAPRLLFLVTVLPAACCPLYSRHHCTTHTRAAAGPACLGGAAAQPSPSPVSCSAPPPPAAFIALHLAAPAPCNQAGECSEWKAGGLDSWGLQHAPEHWVSHKLPPPNHTLGSPPSRPPAPQCLPNFASLSPHIYKLSLSPLTPSVKAVMLHRLGLFSIGARGRAAGYIIQWAPRQGRRGAVGTGACAGRVKKNGWRVEQWCKFDR